MDAQSSIPHDLVLHCNTQLGYGYQSGMCISNIVSIWDIHRTFYLRVVEGQELAQKVRVRALCHTWIPHPR